jgi:hypothetical protein
MIKRLLMSSVGLILYFGLGCSLAPVGADRTPASERSSSRSKVWRASDPALKRGDLTVWKLKELAQNKDFETLERLFKSGVSLDRLPVGYAAGTGARVLGMPTEAGLTLIDNLTGLNWRGKIFFESKDPKASHGLNRIRRIMNGDRVPIVPMAAFETRLMSRHELVPEVTSNFVILNYTHPLTVPYWQERILTKIQVYDIMVAVPGKYGPVYVGKTWLGSYNESGEFRAYNPSELIAWYFLDFNQGALDEQMSHHWDDSPESPIDYRLKK